MIGRSMLGRALALGVTAMTVFCVSAAPVSGAPTPASATVNVRVEGPTGTIFEGDVTTTAHDVTSPTGGTHVCDGTNDGVNPSPGPTTLTALDDAAHQAGFTWDGPWESQFQDYYVNSIQGVSATPTQFWGLLVNYQFTSASGCQTQVHDGDQVLWAFDAFNQAHFLKLTGPSQVLSGQPFTVTVVDGSSGAPVFGASVGGVLTNGNGVATLTETTPGPVTLKATLSTSLRSNGLVVQVEQPDQTPPVLTVPTSPVVAEATSAGGATVNYQASATDNVDGALTPICAPSSASTFPLGSTTVTCTATDTAGNTGQATFSVLVRDTTPPTLTLPGPITAPATSPGGTSVSYSASASDLVSGTVNADCAPRSAATFAIGTTTVTCTATDAAGNSTFRTFTVTVQGAVTQISNLNAQVKAANLPRLLGTSLSGELALASAAVARGKNNAAAVALAAFILEVRAQPSKNIPATTATAWIANATRIEHVLGH